MYLPDVNLWLAASWSRHTHHSLAADWLNETSSTLHFCRITQLAFLRLITHPSIMQEDALTRTKAWSAYKTILSDPRISFLDEPDQLEASFESFSGKGDRSHKLWTDDYLAAFAQAAKLKFVTLDKAAAKRYPETAITIG